MDTLEKNKDEIRVKTSSGDDSSPAQEVAKTTPAGPAAVPHRPYLPVVDLLETDKDVTLIVDVPGVPESGVGLSIEKNILSLSATPVETAVQGKRLAYSEYGIGEYKRSFALSEEVDRENVHATLKNGVLRIVLPKMKPVSKKISLSSQ